MDNNKNSDELGQLNQKQTLILFFINCEPGIKEIYDLVKIFDRADFPSEMDINTNILLSNSLIIVNELFYNGTEKNYLITELGKNYLEKNFNSKEITEYIKSLDNPDFLLELANLYLKKYNFI